MKTKAQKLHDLATHPYYGPIVKKIPADIIKVMFIFLAWHEDTDDEEYATMILRNDYPVGMQPKKDRHLINEVLLICK